MLTVEERSEAEHGKQGLESEVPGSRQRRIGGLHSRDTGFMSGKEDGSHQHGNMALELGRSCSGRAVVLSCNPRLAGARQLGANGGSGGEERLGRRWRGGPSRHGEGASRWRSRGEFNAGTAALERATHDRGRGAVAVRMITAEDHGESLRSRRAGRWRAASPAGSTRGKRAASARSAAPRCARRARIKGGGRSAPKCEPAPPGRKRAAITGGHGERGCRARWPCRSGCS